VTDRGRLLVGVAQPRTITDGNAERNVARATELVARAAGQGCDIILFPEGYPGPVLRRPKDTYDAAASMDSAAADNDIAVCWSRMELCPDGEYRLVVYAIDRNGEQMLRYPRAHPATIPVEQSIVSVSPGEDLGSFRLDGVMFGVVVCSEIWVPEPTRVLALRGAEVILSPAGGGFTSLTENWQTLIRARAIENLAYVAMTNNIWRDEVGAAMVAGPEGLVAGSGFDELIVADLDLERVRWLRAQDDSIEEPKAFASIPGLLRFRRPELYDDLVKPADGDYDFLSKPGGRVG
jgi:5-aminopentanamidase